MKYLLLTLSFFMLISCQSETETETEQQIEEIQEIELIDSHSENNIAELKNLYTVNAVKVDKTGKVFHNQGEIIEYYQKNDFSNSAVEVIKSVAAGQEHHFEYEISQFENANGQLFKQLIIWDLDKKPKKRTFEFVAEANNTENDKTIIDERRNEWIHLCNQHNAQNLLEEIYTENTIYYNHKPVIVGHEDLAVEYKYMNNEQYELFLKPIIVEMVQNDLVYEIGQCSGTYGGKYILIWQKGKDNVWRVLVDSNI
ncbi:MAG: hypothetical protein AB8G11_00845 [Saprospiraceae bacterium]